jgi:hypothetical protein
MPTLSQDIRRGLDHALKTAITEWTDNGGRGMKPQIVLVTLTQKHSGDILEDQRALAEGWRKLYKRMNEDYGKFPYVGVWEVTPGKDGLGHVHVHIAVVWRYRDWSRIRTQWMRACPTSSYITFVAKRRDGKASSAGSAANYLGKYLSKGADVGGFTPHMRAEVSAAFYNQRSVISSLGFWRRQVKCCRQCSQRYRLVEIDHPALEFLLPNITVSIYARGLEPPRLDLESRAESRSEA